MQPDQSRKFSAKEKRIIESVFNLYMGASLLCMPFNMADSMLISSRAQECAEAHILLGRQHKQYMLWLERLSTGSAYAALISAHAPIVIGILANHNLLPSFGFSAPVDTQKGPDSATDTTDNALFRNPSTLV